VRPAPADEFHRPNPVDNARKPNSARSALPFLAGTLRYDIAPLLEEVSVPTLMMWGDNEIQIRADVRRQIERANPKIELVRISRARSCFDIERPAETVERMLAFLDGSESAGGDGSTSVESSGR
jgi:pimeloyl-ACP methyl ester carboxylesterase